MKSYLIFSLALALAALSSSCLKPELKTKEKIPSCVKNKIRAIKAQRVWNPPAMVWKWEDECGNVYYHFSSDCCDQFTELYDENCNYMCAPSGGFSGGGSGDCPDLCGNVESTLVWEDSRERK